MAKRLCKNCDYYDNPGGPSGFCRHHSPTVTQTGRAWPQVFDTDWCGEFKVRGGIEGYFKGKPISQLTDEEIEEMNRTTYCG